MTLGQRRPPRRSPRWPPTAALRRETSANISPSRRRRKAGPPRHNTSGVQQWTSPYRSRQVRGRCHYLESFVCNTAEREDSGAEITQRGDVLDQCRQYVYSWIGAWPEDGL